MQRKVDAARRVRSNIAGFDRSHSGRGTSDRHQLLPEDSAEDSPNARDLLSSLERR
jgi:hypothetical protein